MLSLTVCNLPADAGPCRASIQRFFFDFQNSLCKNFTYGGCKGNDNRFVTKQDCESACGTPDDVGAAGATPGAQVKDPKHNDVSDSIATATKPTDICSLPSDSGPCFAKFSAVFFNRRSGQCESFVYGGCGGNENRFESVQACELACRGVGRRPNSGGTGSVSGTWPAVATTTGRFFSSNNECNLPKAGGPCEAYIPSYFYSMQTGQCESFVYGGCEGNVNRFDSRMQCEQKCKAGAARPDLKAACLQPKKLGLCRARLPRWFFDAGSRSCRLFYYGGCGGNANNFLTRLACERLCVKTPGQQYRNSYLPSVLQYLLLHLFGAMF